MSSVLKNPVLVLNKSWLPHDSTIVAKSLAVVWSERGLYLDPVSYTPHDVNSWMKLPVGEGEEFIQTTCRRIKAPEIMLLAEYSQVPKREVVFCRRNLWRRDKRRCQYCGMEPEPDEITIDHIVPKSKGGESEFENCVLCCMKCNLKKGNRSLERTGMRLRRLKRFPNGEWTTVYYDSPKRPRWNPLYALRRKSYPKSWAAFLKNFDEALYWEVELET